jgi:hypothetical protein
VDDIGLQRQVQQHDKRLARIERAMFGFLDDVTGKWVDGVVQVTVDIRDEARGMRREGRRASLIFAVVLAVILLPQFAHNLDWLLPVLKEAFH